MMHVYGDEDPTAEDRARWEAADDRAKRFGGVAIRIPIDPYDGFLRPTVITKSWDKWVQDVKSVLDPQVQIANLNPREHRASARDIQAQQLEILARRTQIHDMRSTENESDHSYIRQLHSYLPEAPLTPMEF